MLLFIVVAGALYLRFRSPHKVPGHASIAAVTAPGPPEQGGGASGAVSAQGHGESAADGTEAAHGTDEG
jgi:hypothetical protein